MIFNKLKFSCFNDYATDFNLPIDLNQMRAKESVPFPSKDFRIINHDNRDFIIFIDMKSTQGNSRASDF